LELHLPELTPAATAAMISLGFAIGFAARGPQPSPVRGAVHRRQPPATMIEAYDLVPMLSCLKGGSPGEIEQCMQTISPWLSVTDEGKLFLSEAAAGGFIGGSVGVIGTVVSTFMKRDQVKDRLKCPYCYGTGQIVCGRCYGTGLTTSKIAGTDEWQESDCNTCERAGTVVCINCQGSGLSVPEDILQKLGDSEVGFTEEDYIGLFDEVKFPTLNNQGPSGSDAAGSAAAGSADEASERDEVLVAAGEKEAGPSPEDFTGGLG